MSAKFMFNLAAALVALAFILIAAEGRTASPPAPPPLIEPDLETDFFDARAIHFKNGCASPIEAAISFETVDGDWTVSEWVRLRPEETAKVGWTRAPLFYSTMRRTQPRESASALPKNGLWAKVPGDAEPTPFAMRPIGEQLGGDVTQVFFCPQ